MPNKEFTAILFSLQKDPQAIAWPRRRVLAKAVCESLSDEINDITLDLMFELAGDPKWEVRKDIADSLLQVPEDAFPRIAAKLSDDANAFVQKAVERALDRRKRGQESEQLKQRGLDHVQSQYANIKKIHGDVAAQKAQQMAERLYDVLVGSTVHDMRNILAPLKSSIASMLSHFSDRPLSPNTFEKKLSKMGYQASMLERLMEDMRTYSQPTPLERHHERMADIVQEAHNIILDAFKATGRHASHVEACFDVPQNMIVEASRHQMVRVISNVLKNAYESFAIDSQIFGEGHIHFKAQQVDEERVEIVVRDNGMGLSEEELREVRRFVPGGTSKKTHGTGFGLPIAKRKIEDHGGSLAIESQENIGTTVTITLPIEVGGIMNEFSCVGD